MRRRFGFETDQTMVHGLWQGPTAMTLDFITVVRRIKALGFNMVRLPFSMTVRRPTSVPIPHSRLPLNPWEANSGGG